MLSNRTIRLSFLVVAMFVVGVYPAYAQQQSGEQPPPVTQAAPPVEQPVEAEPPQGQTLAVGNPGYNAEASFFIGGLIGGDLFNLLTGDFSLSSTLENGRTYGGRLGYYKWPVGVEGSFAYSDSGLAFQANLDGAEVRLAARVMYAEANALVMIIPGPVQPFVTGGGGMHSYKMSDLRGVEINKWGWNFGGGVKINISRVSLRADIRDHMTPNITAADLNLDPELAELLGIDSQTLHNVEFSFGLGFRF